MAIRQGFFNSPDSQNPDRLYFAENWNDINDITFGDGFSLKKTPDQTFVKFNPAGVGEILIDIIDFAALLRGYYYTQESQTIQKSLPLATLDRIDLIVLRLQGNSSASRVLSVEVIQGVESGSPVAPPINVGVGDIWDLVLAQVFVTGGQATLPNGQSDITMVVAKMELAGFAAEATKTFQDENGRSIANNLKINSYNQLEDIGLTDADMSPTDIAANMTLIFSNLSNTDNTTGKVLHIDALNINPNLKASVATEISFFGGYLKFEVFGSGSNLNVMKNVVSAYTNQNAPDPYKIHVGVYDNVWKSFQLQLTEDVGIANDSDKLDGFEAVEFAKRNSTNPAGSIPSGWRRLVQFTSSGGRGSWIISLRSKSGTTAKGTVLHVHCSSSVALVNLFESLSIISNNLVEGVWDKFRLTHDGTFKYLEFNAVSASLSDLAISVLPLIEPSIDQSGYTILDPKVVAGGGTVINSAINNGEVEETRFLANWNQKFYIGIDGNSASGILLEDFGAGLAITTSTSSASATLITAKADKTKYSSCMLLVGMTNNQRTFIEIELDTFTQTSQAFDFTKSPTIGSDIFDDFQAKIFVDQPANEIRAYEARNRKWDGVAANAAIDIVFSSLRIFKVWGIVR